MKIMDKLRKLLGVRSPSLERFGYYTCRNCQRHSPNCICVVCEENEDIVFCTYHRKHVSRYDTCKNAKPISIKPLSIGKFKRGLRADIGVIDEWIGGDIDKEN